MTKKEIFIHDLTVIAERAKDAVRARFSASEAAQVMIAINDLMGRAIEEDRKLRFALSKQYNRACPKCGHKEE